MIHQHVLNLVQFTILQNNFHIEHLCMNFIGTGKWFTVFEKS